MGHDGKLTSCNVSHHFLSSYALSRLPVVSRVAKESRIFARKIINKATTVKIYIHITKDLVNTPTETQHTLLILIFLSYSDVNAPNDHLLTPLHLAYLCGHTQIVQCLIQHSADMYVVDNDSHILMSSYIDGDSKWIKSSAYSQTKRGGHHIPYSFEHMKLINRGTDEKPWCPLQCKCFHCLNMFPLNLIAIMIMLQL